PEIYFLEASVIYERVVGKKCQEYAGTLQGLAQVYQKSSQYDQAEASFFEAGKIWLEVFGNTHPYYLDHLDKLAEFYCESGHCQKAEPIHLKINNIRQISRRPLPHHEPLEGRRPGDHGTDEQLLYKLAAKENGYTHSFPNCAA
ncbi:MAG: tetratricopeptide repeat protein, partial [Saprospiraceae bacterium]|nr:tetratricopeptide repeat protein [Saprospiraceae bacterium]